VSCGNTSGGRISRGVALGVLAFGVASRLFAADLSDARTEPVISIIDTHAHIIRNARRENVGGTAIQAFRAMDQYRVEMTILLPPPFPPAHPGTYGRRELGPLARQNSGRFAFVAGGDSLNPMIQAVAPDKVTPEIVQKFKQEADAIAKAGAVGFGEFAAEHFSSGRGGHPYESASPDHPLFLVLADIAARYGMPIDLHMEAVPRDMPMPERMVRGPNPETLKENIPALERLLAHNRNARIVWAHAGWDLTGERTVPLMRSLLEKNSNLYMSVKLDESGSQRNSPLGPDGKLRPDWLALLRDFPDRFVIGSDQFYDQEIERLARVRTFVDLLPPDVVRRVARENAKLIYRLDLQAK
jgi:predicted TIM-barrel fold metal-dependent hydrolase